MPQRELTDKENEMLMSQAEVDAMPSGSIVMVKWPGGNGPHPYMIIQHKNTAFVAGTLRGKLFQPTERLFPVGKTAAQCRVFRIV